MRQISRRFVVALVLSLTMLLLVSSVAYASYSDKQVTPGTTTRTIWGSNQVAIYELPNGINHTGYMHFEVTFRPSWADFDIYLIGPANKALNMEMGYNASFTGKEVIDFNVTRVTNTTIVDDPYSGPYMVGDRYYVAVVAFNETARFQISGYYPQIDLSVSQTTNAKDNFYFESFRMPRSKTAWKTLSGTPYGKPWDFIPTSLGTASVGLEWPASVVDKEVTYDLDNAPSPANYESYVYAGVDWDTVFEAYGDSYFTPPAQAAMMPTWPLPWYGHFNTIAITPGEVGENAGPPMLTYHFIPSLYLAAADPMVGANGALKTGITTVGYKATLVYPENLRITRAPGRVFKGTKATLKGKFALDGEWAADKAIQIWARPYGTKTWKKVGTPVMTDASGSWVKKVTVKAKTYYRAGADGNPASGLEYEYSWSRLIYVK